MKGQAQFLQKLIDLLEAAGIAYAVCGSLGSSLHGQPRATNDADIIIAPTANQLAKFLKSLEFSYYVSSEAASEAMRQRSMFNVIDSELGWKADFIIRRDRAFSREEFRRRQNVKLMELDICMVSPEDVILSKLEWAKNSESDQQFRDALGVAVVQWDHLDKDYLLKWAKELQVDGLLKQLLDQAKKLTDSK